jgi:hypothetical protein
VKLIPATLAFAAIALSLSPFAIGQTVKPCRANQLTVLIRGLAGDAGHEADMVRVSNKSASSCTVSGMPAITFLGTAGRRVPLSICANCAGALFPAQPVADVTLNPGDSAHFFLGYVSSVANGSSCQVVLQAQVFFGRDPIPLPLFHKDHPSDDLFTADSLSICNPDVSGWRPGLFQRGETQYRLVAILHARTE